MARLGVSREDLVSLTQVFKSAQHVVMEGVFTHLAAAEVIDAPAPTPRSAASTMPSPR